MEAASAFLHHFEEHRIWLDEDICADIERVADGLYVASVDFTTYPHDDPADSNERLDAWMKAWNAVSTEIPETRKSIERRVRELLGVTSPTP